MTQEVLKLALEALEASISITMPKIALRNEAITALREALTQPQQEQQEPVAFEPNDADLLEAFTRSNNGPNPFYRCNICGDTEPGVREYLVAHWLKHNTSPPQRTWVGLSDDEALECWPGLAMYADCAKFWGNIEAKLKEKNT